MRGCFGQNSLQPNQKAFHQPSSKLSPTLNELEVLAHRSLDNAIMADGDHTRILAVPVDALDSLIDHDPDFARRVIALESQRLQQIANPLAATP